MHVVEQRFNKLTVFLMTGKVWQSVTVVLCCVVCSLPVSDVLWRREGFAGPVEETV